MQFFLVSTVFFSLVSLGVAEFKSKPVPSYISVCPRSNPDGGECTKNSARAAVPFLLKGDKRYKIPNLLPLKISKLVANSGDNLQLTLTDVSLFGLENLSVDKIKLDPVAKHAEMIVTNKWINVDGQYNMTGHVLILPISGDGPANMTFYDSTFNYKMDYEVIKRNDGKDYLHIVKSSTDIDIPKAYFHFDNLFNGNKELGDHMNNFLNENTKDVLRDLGYPVVAELVQVIVTDVFNAITGVVPYDELLPNV